MPLADYARLPRRTAGFRSGFGPLRGPSTPQGAGYGSDVYQWAAGVVEKIRVASAGGRFRFLPWHDPYTEETPEMRASYRLMLADPIVLGAFRTTVFSVISQEWQFQPDDDDDPRQREAVEFCRYAFAKIEGGTPAVGWSILAHGQIDGHSVCEPVWREEPVPFGRFRGKRVFQKVKAKDTRFLQLGIDSYRNVTAVRGMGFNAGRVYDPAGFAVFSNLPLFENPAGMSAMRSCYGAFWRKDTALKLRSLHLSNYVGPYLKGTYGDASAKLALEEAFADAKSDHWLTVPATCLVEAIDLSMKGTEEFQRTIDYEDKIILVALTGSHLPQMESTSGSGQRGNTKVQQEQGQLVPWYLSACLCEVAKKSLVAPLIAENYYGVEPPSVTLGAISEQARLQLVQVFKGMQELGLDLSKSQTYKDLGQQQPAEADDVLRPPGQGGGDAGGGLPGMPPGGGGPGGAPGSPFSEARPFDDVYHGPKPPRSAWRDFACREVTGPRGGKKHQTDGGPPRYGPCPKGKEAVALGRQARQEAKAKAQEEARAVRDKARQEAKAARNKARADARAAAVAARADAARQASEAKAKLRARVKELAADPARITPEAVKEIGAALPSLTAPELAALQKDLGLGGGATKPERIRRIIDRALTPPARPDPPKVPAPKDPARAAEQYRQLGTQAPAFREWFGEWQGDPAGASKVVRHVERDPQRNQPLVSGEGTDAEGVPVAVYHGTPWDEFERFDKSRLAQPEKLLFGPGFYFTQDAGVAERVYQKGQGSLVGGPKPRLKGTPEEASRRLKAMLNGRADELEGLAKQSSARSDELARQARAARKGGEATSLFGQSATENNRAAQQYEKARRARRLAAGDLFGPRKIEKNVADLQSSLEEVLGGRVKEVAERPPGHLFQVYLNIRRPFDGDKDRVPTASLPAAVRSRAGQRAGEVRLSGKPVDQLTGAEWDKVRQALQATGNAGGARDGKAIRTLLGAGGQRPEKALAAYARGADVRAALKKAGLEVGWHLPPEMDYEQLKDALGSKARANAHLQAQGYDGITHVGGVVHNATRHRVWIAFEPSQVKAVGNQGTFDPTDPSIKHADAPAPDAEQLRAVLAAALSHAAAAERDRLGVLTPEAAEEVRAILSQAG